MNPLLLSGLLSMAPGLLSHLFGGSNQDRLRRQVQKLLAPQNQSNLTNQFYQQALGSPAYSQAQGTIAAGANQAGGQLAQALGARGIGTSGSAAVLSSLMPSLIGSQQAGLRTSAYNSAQSQAMQNIQEQIKNLTGTAGPSQSAQMFAGGMNAFAPMLQQWFNSKYPTPNMNQNQNAGSR